MKKKWIRDAIKFGVKTKTWKIMRLSAFFLFLFAAQVWAGASYSQQIKLTLKMDNARVIDVLDEIENRSEFYFLFNQKLVDVERKVDVDAKEKPIDNILSGIFSKTNVSYVVKDRMIILTTEKQNVNEGINLFQQNSVSGKVTDSSGQPLPGVAVVVKGTTQGAVTNVDGEYTITNLPENATLQFSFVGMRTQEIVVGNQNTINVSMLEDAIGIEEVVAIGYGSVKKRDLTGSVSSVKSENFNDGVINSPEELMAGKLPGVQIIQNSSEPGGGFSVSIRGVSSINAGTEPLYVIDGLPIDNSPVVGGTSSMRGSRNPLSSINPNDIESIEVLKDASATAIYGARGANGVIIITTKKGLKGGLQVNYDYYQGVQSSVKRFDILDAKDYQSILNKLLDDGATNAAESERVTEIIDGGTDWQNEVYRKSASVSSHNLSISGGNERTIFFIGLNYFSQEGIVKKSSFERYGLRLNIDHSAKDNLKFGVHLSNSYNKDNFIPGGFGGNSGGLLNSARNYDPTVSVYSADGDYSRSTFMGLLFDSPVALLNGDVSSANAYRTIGSLYGEYNFLPDFTFKVNLGGDMYNQQKDRYVDQTTLQGMQNEGSATINNALQTNYLMEGLLTYSKRIKNNHNIVFLIGNTYQRFINFSHSMTGEKYPVDMNIIKTFDIGSSDELRRSIGSGKSSNSLLSYLTRINYSFKDKYLLTFSYRIDGSSRFGGNNKFSYFPSIAGGWHVGEEDFFTSFTSFVNMLKLRGSWGKTGNDQIGNYQSLTTFGGGGIAVLNDNPVSTLVPTRIGNPNLKWETTEQLNFGLDFGLWESKILGSFDWYQKNTYDMLINLPIPTSSGYSSQTQNIGSMKNSGIEIGITTRNLNKKLKWNSNLNFTTLRNRVISLGEIEQIITGSAGFATQVSIIKEGYPVRSFYGYEIEGIWQEGDDFSKTTDNVQPGDFKYKDLTKDGTVNADDRVMLGNSIPQIAWSLGNIFQYKRFELNVFFEGVQGVSMYNGILADTYFPIDFRRNKLTEPMVKRWTAENPSNTYPSLLNPLGQGEKYVNSYTVEDASYIRLKSIRVSYNLPSLKNIFESATLYVTAQNLYTWTAYSGMDPAVNPNANKTLRIDYDTYPLTKMITGGVTINF